MQNLSAALPRELGILQKYVSVQVASSIIFLQVQRASDPAYCTCSEPEGSNHVKERLKTNSESFGVHSAYSNAVIARHRIVQP